MHNAKSGNNLVMMLLFANASDETVGQVTSKEEVEYHFFVACCFSTKRSYLFLLDYNIQFLTKGRVLRIYLRILKNKILSYFYGLLIILLYSYAT